MTRLLVAALATGTMLAASQATEPRSRQIEPSTERHDSTGSAPTAPDPVPTEVTMRNVDFHVGDGVVLHIRRLRGSMRGQNGVVDFDDVSSYTVEVSAAEVGLAGDDLTNLLNRYVFAYPGAPLSKLRVRVGSDGLRQSGILHKGVDIPFDMTANVSLTSDGRIRLHAARMKIFGVNGLALMSALGLSLEKMIDLSRAHGITAKDNDLFMEATALLPPPKFVGKLAAVRIDGDQLVQTFGNPADSVPPPQTLDPAATNFMLYRGGTLHFTKLLMTDAEMLVVDADPQTPFDFDNPGYRKQLVAGRSRTLPDMGLEVWMPDARSLGKSTP